MSLRSLPSKVSLTHPAFIHTKDIRESLFFCLDWDDSQTDLAHLGGVAPGAAKSEGDKLWEDNWDDDDIEEEFSVQLR
jgi:DSS1/SEM1 family